MPLRNGFNRPFVTADMPGGEDVWKVVVGFFYRDKTGVKHYVKPNTVTDGASIPRFLWPLIGHPRDTDIGQAAAMHDVLYREGKLSRQRCDELMVEAMGCLDASWMKRQAVYYGLRAGAWVAWKNYRAKDNPPA